MTPAAPNKLPSWFPMPTFVPTTEVLLHAAEMRVAEAKMEAKQASLSRTPSGKLKKGEIEAFNAADKECDDVFRIHAEPVREWIYQERSRYGKEAVRVVFLHFVESATHVLNSPSGIAERLGVRVGQDPHVPDSAFNKRGMPFFNLESPMGTNFQFVFTVDECIISRVELYTVKNERYDNVLSIAPEGWGWKDKTKTKIGSVHFGSGDPEKFIEASWILEATARLCMDVDAFNQKHAYDEYHSWEKLYRKAERDAISMTHDDCYVPEPIEKTNDQE